MEAIKFAYVKYLKDNEKDIVPLSLIKKFHPKHLTDFHSKTPYKVQWQRDVNEASSSGARDEVFYKALILMLGSTKEELQSKLDGARIRIPKVLDTSVESSSEEEPISSQVSKERKEKKKDQEAAKKKVLKSVMTENLLKKKRAPLFPATESECSQECVNKLHQARKRWREAEERNASLETESKRLRKDSEEYRQLNKDLQLELLKHLKLKTNTSVPNYSSSKANKPKPCSPFSSTSSRQSDSPPDNSETSSLSAPQTEQGKIDNDITDSAEEPQLIDVTDDEKVQIGGVVSITKKQWEALRRHPKHSLFVKNLAVSVWGSEILKNRSVHGKACNRFKGKKETKQPLTPVKLDAVKDCFLNRLESLKVDAEMRQTEMSKFTRYIAEKIQDINRLSRKIGEE